MRYLYLTIALTVLTSCLQEVHEGSVIDDEKIRNIVVSVSVKGDVINDLDAPSFIIGDHYYYVSHSSTRRAFLRPKVVHQKMIDITFKDGVVADIVVTEKDITPPSTIFSKEIKLSKPKRL